MLTDWSHEYWGCSSAPPSQAPGFKSASAQAAVKEPKPCCCRCCRGEGIGAWPSDAWCSSGGGASNASLGARSRSALLDRRDERERPSGAGAPAMLPPPPLRLVTAPAHHRRQRVVAPVTGVQGGAPRKAVARACQRSGDACVRRKEVGASYPLSISTTSCSFHEGFSLQRLGLL